MDRKENVVNPRNPKTKLIIKIVTFNDREKQFTLEFRESS